MGTFLIGVLAVWALVIGIWFSVSKWFRNADVDRMKSRILETEDKKEKKQRTAPGAPALIRGEDGAGGNPLLQAILKQLELTSKVAKLLEQAGLRWPAARLLQMCIIATLIGFAVAKLFLPIPYLAGQIGVGLVMGLLPLGYVMRLRSSRISKFEEQFPESLEFVARSMRAGHAFSVSLEMIHREFADPLGGEFRRAFDEHNLGMPLDQALIKLANRVPILDVSFFVSAVLLQKRTGGNLAEILDKLAYVIRERFKLRGKIRAISAHGKMTGTALTLIPCGVAVMMFYANPEYVSFFVDDETGHLMAGAAVALVAAGYGVIHKIVQIEV
jgi:tight adherence protein B